MSLMLVLQQVYHVHEQDRILVCVPGSDPAVEVPQQNFFLVLLGHCHFPYLSVQTHLFPKYQQMLRKQKKCLIALIIQ